MLLLVLLLLQVCATRLGRLVSATAHLRCRCIAAASQPRIQAFAHLFGARLAQIAVRQTLDVRLTQQRGAMAL
jgi:hypothetical protein